MLKATFKLISLIFHPLFLFILLLLISYGLNPRAFGFSSSEDASIMLIMAIAILVIIPIITTLMMKGLGFIASLSMKDPKERIGPLIAVIICYVWHYVNVMNHQHIPDTYAFISLAGCISVGLVFFINNFSKISMHTVGAGALCMGVISLLYINSFTDLKVILFGVILSLSPLLLIMSAVLLAGLLGSSRLALNAHKNSDIYGGYIVGVVSVLIALRVVF